MNFTLCTIVFIFFSSFPNLFHTLDINNNAQGSNNTDRLALLAFKSHISHDPQGVLNSWNDSISLCQWQGVTCGGAVQSTRRVIGLRLVSYGLVGTLSPSVGNLSFLQNLSLSDNNFMGHIPPQIGSLLRLRFLVLHFNSFEGEVPASISRCSKLEALDLAHNKLSGRIPHELSRLSNLVSLILQQNRFTGDILNTVVMNMTSLQKLSAAYNFFEGSIPDNIGVLTNLFFIGLSQNEISGTIPPSLYNMSWLSIFDVDLNRLEGTLPFDIGFRLPQLRNFNIGGNHFHGTLPASLSNLTQLVELSVYSNHFTGKFMFSGRDMPGLRRLDISLNYLGMRQPDDLNFIQTLSNCSQLNMLECASNRFGGVLPHSLGNLSSTHLTYLDFQQNAITGSIPLELFNLVNLRRLGLSYNKLTGHLPPEIANLRKLQAFSASDNYLTGNIPYSLGNLSFLSELYLSENSLRGTIPPNLGECSNLLYLKLSENNLTGSLPSLLFHASMLVEVHLDQNHLQGVIPMEIDQLRNLVVLDVTGNALSGQLPSSLASCTDLLELHLGGNLFIGSIPQSFKTLSSINQLNLSHNRLSGQIPDFLSTFPLVELDLSFNNLEGEVPRNGIFANISAVKMVGNSKLCGGIPEIHLPRCSTNTTSKRRLSVLVTLIIAVASLVVGVSILYAIYVCIKGKNKPPPRSLLNLNEPFSKVSYNMLLEATDGFSEANLIGAGSFGSVYKGVLDAESSMVVAIKVISLKQKGAIKSFMAECEALRNIRHRNLLKILTACLSTDFHGNDFKALVYEFMPNGNLQQWIHVALQTKALTVLQRVNIAIDVALAIDYLHNNCEVPVIHCDLKPSNILLDNDMVAHVGDFGLAKFHSHASTRDSSSVAVRGTVGYAAPEYGLGSMVSTKGDIYSFGIVLIEMMTAIFPTDQMFVGGLDLHKYAKSALSDPSMNIIDPGLLTGDDVVVASNGSQYVASAINDHKVKCLRSIIEIGVKCSVESPQDRMRIEDAVRELQIARDLYLKELSIIEAMQF